MKLSLFQILSLLPLAIGYLALSWGAWRERKEYRSWDDGRVYIVHAWMIITIIIWISLFIIAFTTN